MNRFYVGSVLFLMLQTSSCIVADGPSKCTSDKFGSLGLENKLDLRIRGKGLKFSDIDTIYVHSYIKGSKLGVLSKSDTLKLTRYLCAFLADDTVYYSIYTSNIIDEPLDNKYYYRLKSEFDYILKIPKISKEYKLTDFRVIDTSYSWPSENHCEDDPLENFKTIRFKVNGVDTGTISEITLEATP